MNDAASAGGIPGAGRCRACQGSRMIDFLDLGVQAFASRYVEAAERHRPEPAVDGIVLMAQSLVLGPGARCHIVCKDWSAEVVLFRQAGSGGLDGWGCRATGGLTVDGQAQSSPAALTERSRVCGEDFCFSLESLG